MAFPCPGCGVAVERNPDSWALRCSSCGAVLRSRAVEHSSMHPAFEVEVTGRPETRRRVEVQWDAAQRRRLGAWLLWSSAVTLGLVVVLYALARWYRP